MTRLFHNFHVSITPFLPAPFTTKHLQEPFQFSSPPVQQVYHAAPSEQEEGGGQVKQDQTPF